MYTIWMLSGIEVINDVKKKKRNKIFSKSFMVF